MSKTRTHKKKKVGTKVGQKPGFLLAPEGALPTRLFLISFSENTYAETEYQTFEPLWEYLQNHPEEQHWLDVRGYKSLDLLEQIATAFHIHALQLEDIISEYQRPKMQEEYGSLFLVSRMLVLTPEMLLDDDQLSLITGPNYVITFQSDYEDCLDPLRLRIRAGKGIIRKRPVLYMAFAIMDVVLDHYYPVLSQFSEYLDKLEDDLLEKTDKALLAQILCAKRETAKLRRILWAERDKINELLRADPGVVAEELKIYFRDSYDHAVQMIDLTETNKEMTANLVELYMSSVSNRMNEIMKVLTIISSIFIPLSFIVGLYGMNFSRENPATGQENPLNMPELYHPYGYVTLLAVMGTLILLQLIFFYRKGWLSKF